MAGWKLRHILFALLCLAAATSAQAEGLVKILVTPALNTALSGELSRYEADLRAEGYTTSRESGTWDDAESVRALLQGARGDGLVGAVLIGDLPMARFNLNKNLGDVYWHDFLTPLFYMDLDGNWGGKKDGVYTRHNGNIEAEIWVGVIRADNLQNAGSETTLLRNYFDRVHAYREGTHTAPPARGFEFYHTIKPNYSDLGALYSTVVDRGCETSADQLESLLADPDGFEFAVINTASGASVHHFHELAPGWPLPESYWVSSHEPDDVDAQDILDIDPKVLFYQLATSETGRVDQPDNLAGCYVFGTSHGLAALAATQHTILGDYFYDPLAAGKTLGEAALEDMNGFLADLEAGANTSTVWCEAWDPDNGPEKLTQRFYAGVLLGDPTLRVRSRTTGVRESRRPEVPRFATLSEGFPNPFREQTSVTLSLERDATVSAAVFDVSGRLVDQLYSGFLNRGDHLLRWQGIDETLDRTANSGVYFLRALVRVEGQPQEVRVRRLVYVR